MTMATRRRSTLMRIAALALAGAALLAPLAAASEWTPGSDAADDGPSDVVVLNKDNYDTFLKEHPLTLVEYYAPWCGHCKKLKPEYDKAATELKANKPPITIAKVDCTQEKAICERENVPGFPTLKIFHDGAATEYKGERNAESIVTILKRQLLPAVSILTKDTLKEFTDASRVSVIGVFPESAKAEKEVFTKVAQSLRDDFTFGMVADAAALPSEIKVTAPSIVLFKKFDEGHNVFKGEIKAETIRAFVAEKSIPLMDEIGPQNYQVYIDRNLPIGFFFYGNPEQKSKHGPDFEAVAKEFVGKLSFVYLDASKFGSHASNLALKEEWPAFGIQERLSKYPFDQSSTLTRDSIRKFAQDVVDGKITPTLKSEPVPETQPKNVKVLVGKNFNSIVRDTNKDVFVEFYAPWCGHCKKLAPTWDELGEILSPASDKVVIAKMDATANDIPPETTLDIQGFPTIVLFTAKDNTMITFDGDRSLDSMLEFVKKNAAHADAIKDLVAPEGTAGKKDGESEEPHEEL